MENRIRRTVAPLAAAVYALLLAGCNFWVAGHSSDYGLVVHGTGIANVGDNTTTFNLEADGKDIKCQGNSKPIHKPGDTAQGRSLVEIVCSDGRRASGESVLTSMEGGTGTGTDTCGNEVEMYFNINQLLVAKQLEQYRQVRKASPGGFDRCDAPGDAPPHRDPLI